MQWWNIENRMVVEGERYQRELYSKNEEDDDHIEFVGFDGTTYYEQGYGLDEYGRVVYLCDTYECEECPRYMTDCELKGEK